jgi:hypothetical protein
LFAGLGGTSLLGSAKVFADFGSAVHDMSGRTGLAADNLSELKYAAEQTGASLGDVEKAIKFMQKQGIDAGQFDAIAEAVSNIADDTERAQVAMKLFGRTGTMILPMLRDLPALRERARALGATLTPDQAAKADELGDSFGDLKTALLGVTLKLGAALAPVLTVVTQMLTIAAVGLGRFAEALAHARDNAKTPTAQFAKGMVWSGPLAPLKWLLGQGEGLLPQGKKPAPPALDFGGLEGLLHMSGGPSSRGTFHGQRASALSIGSGGGVKDELKGIRKVLEGILRGVGATVDAVEDIREPAFE